ncbi:MAG: class I SAM-dependent RNA methyltransferase [Verrucomicrobiae bacterium]|nr:class I SAM-dependent RNA methyltransferase [Verrucomicrobiae bacterium]
MPAPGSLHEVTIQDIAFGGEGVARIDGQVTFIPDVISGERVRIRILSERKKILQGEAVEILEASADRVRPLCAVFGRCGGCQYQHIRYPAQLALKTKQVRDTLIRIGKIENPPVADTVASPLEYGYRNKITVHGRDGLVGFSDRSGRRLVPLQSCPIARPEVNDQLRDFLKKHKGDDGDFIFRILPKRAGVGPEAFYQTNTDLIPVMTDMVTRAATTGGAEVLVDAYSGAGLFAFELSPHFARVYAIESEPKAVEAAHKRAKLSKATNIEFINGSVEGHLTETLAAAQKQKVCLLLDPPRAGCTLRAIESVQLLPPAQIVYISCNPSTLARDLQLLSKQYRLDSVTPLDMFPQTAHIECVAVLSRRE